MSVNTVSTGPIPVHPAAEAIVLGRTPVTSIEPPEAGLDNATYVRRQFAKANIQDPEAREALILDLQAKLGLESPTPVRSYLAWLSIYAQRVLRDLELTYPVDKFILEANRLITIPASERQQELELRFADQPAAIMLTAVTNYFQLAFKIDFLGRGDLSHSVLPAVSLNTQKITKEQAMFVRRSFAAVLTEATVDEQDFQQMKQQLIEQLASISEAQVSSALAWIDIHAEKTLTKHQIKVDKKEQFIQAACRVLLLPPAERQDFILDSKFLRSIGIDLSSTMLAEYFGKAFGVRFDQERPEGSVPALVSPEVSGVTFDYDNNVKQVWRSAWLRFVEQSLAGQSLAEFLGSDRLVCLPSIVPTREIELYQLLGAEPKQIIGVESTDRHSQRERFATNCQALGIEPRLGLLSEIIMGAPREEAHRLVNFDFTGPLSAEVADSLGYLHYPASGRFIALVNTLAKREQSKAQMLMKVAHNVGRIFEETAEARARQEQLLLNGARDVPEIDMRRGVEDINLRDARYNGGDAMLRVIGFGHSIYHSKYQQQIDQLLKQYPDLGKVHYFQVLFGWVGESLTRGVLQRPLGYIPLLPGQFVLSGQQWKSAVSPKELGELAFQATFKRPFVTKLERLAYLSPPKNSPFHSSFVEYEIPTDFYQRVETSADFIAKIAIAMATAKEELGSGTNLGVGYDVEERGAPVPANSMISEKVRCTAWLKIDGRRTQQIGRIPVKDLHLAVQDYKRVVRQYPLNGEAFFAVPRQPLTN